jgi:hypothetical protein
VPNWLVPSRRWWCRSLGELAAWPPAERQGKSITLLCGAGCAGAHDEVVALAASA